MASKIITKGLKRTALSIALGMCFANTVYAQATTGSVFGQASAGDTIIVENTATGFTREISANADGSFRALSLPTGPYKVTVKHADGTSQVRESVNVSGGVGTAVTFTSTAATLGTVQVLGSAMNPIDVSSVESTTILSAEQIERIPVPRSVTGVALLAPGTTRGDSRLGGDKALASIGGASVAENAYYINGFNVTNILSGTTFNEVPFGATGEIQVKTGGYGAEYGRSLGGVVNVITKKGSNDWHFGGNLIWNPDIGRATALRTIKDVPTNTWVKTPVADYNDALRVNAYASGPILKDRLFFYAIVQGTDTSTKSYGNTRSTDSQEDQPQYLVKLDWNISDNHILEYTRFRDETKTEFTTFVNPYPFSTTHGAEVGGSVSTRGGTNDIIKWTGYLTDNFTLSALYGEGNYSRDDSPANVSSRDDCPVVQDQRTSPAVTYGCWISSRWVKPGSGDKRTAYRVDGEWVLGDHQIKFGLDDEEYKTTDGTIASGPDQTDYIISTLLPGSSAPTAIGYTNNTGSAQQVVTTRKFINGGDFLTKNSAWYVSDTWQVTENFVADIGVRNESFENLNATGGAFISIDNTWAPRLGFSWDVNGDSSTKIFGSAGRYYIPVYANTNVRLSGAELDVQKLYLWTGNFAASSDQTPVLGAQLGNTWVTSDGVVPDARTVVDPNIKPLYQDEYILGFQQQLSTDWTAGARLIYRSLKSAMDDYCSYDFPYNWAIGEGYSEDEAAAIANATNHCFLMNPGKDLTANVDFLGDGNLTTVVIPKAAVGLPDPKRTYKAIDIFFERAWDGKWFLQGSYTWAKSVGNTEGYVKSDNGQDDAGITQDWDYPGLTEGAYGYLPNDRRHTLKMFGAYQVTDQFRVGANLLVQTGRPKNCQGYYSGSFDPAAANYGAASFWCPVFDPISGLPMPKVGGVFPRQQYGRGDFGRLPTTRELGLQVTYEPNWADGLSFTLDAFNVFNERVTTSMEERAEQGGRNSPRAAYRNPLSIQAGRSFRFTVQYDWK